MNLAKNEFPYTPRGAAVDAWNARDDEVVLYGPAGTGKTRIWLEKMNTLCRKYKGFRGMFVRATRESLTNSVMPIFENEVLLPGEFGVHRDALVRYHHGNQRYEYRNGSVIVTAGLDKPGKALSSQYDGVYVNEANQVTKDAWETLSTRLRGPTPTAYKQLMADCNPDHPRHWLKVRIDEKLTRGIRSSHADNPAITPEYLAKLDRLTGVRRKRLRDGEWAAAEGMIYDAWDTALHVVARFDPPPSWQRVWTVDFGMTKPFVWQNWAIDPDGRAYLYQEIYRVGVIVEDHAAHILALTAGQPRPSAIVCDHDLEDRATLERHLNMRTLPATKAIRPGIQAVQARLRPQPDGKPRLMLMTGALVERDPSLVEEVLPLSTEDEVVAYVWDVDKSALGQKEEPIDEYNHGMDAMRYCVAYLDRIERGIDGTATPTPVSFTRASYWNS